MTEEEFQELKKNHKGHNTGSVTLNGITREIKDRSKDIDAYKRLLRNLIVDLNNSMYNLELPIRSTIEQTNQFNFSHLTPNDRKSIEYLKEYIDNQSKDTRNLFSVSSRR